jgi:hypothetical protein
MWRRAGHFEEWKVGEMWLQCFACAAAHCGSQRFGPAPTPSQCMPADPCSPGLLQALRLRTLTTNRGNDSTA